MNYTDQQTPHNVLLLKTGYEAAYNDNLLGQKSGTQPDEEQSANAQITILRQSARLTADINYQPYFQFFQNYTQFNRFNQTLSADGLLGLSPHLSLRLRDDLIDQTGLYSPPGGANSPSGIDSPTALNSTIYTALNNERSITSRADLICQKSARTDVSLFAGYAMRSYSQEKLTPYKTFGQSGGAEFAWRATEHATLGLLGVYNRTDQSGALMQGGAGRMQTVTVTPTFGWRPRPTLELNGFAGPQAIRQIDLQDSTVKGNSSPFRMKWTAGGGVSRNSEGTVLMLSAQHSITDGGGLLSFVTRTVLSGGIRKRIYDDWDVTVGGDYARNSWIPLGTSTASLTEAGGRVMIVRQLRGNAVLQIDYEFIDQFPDGAVGVGTRFHRNRVATSISWSWRSIRLGH